MPTREELQQIQNEIDAQKAVAVKVYDLLKDENVSISDAFEILEIARGYVKGAERRTMLP